MLAHREEIREDLRRMEIVGEPVPDRNARVLREGFHRRVLEPAELDAVKHPAEDAGGILDALLAAELDVVDPQVFGVSALILCADRKGAAGPGGRLLENERNILVRKARPVDALLLLLLELRREVQEILDFLRRKVL